MAFLHEWKMIEITIYHTSEDKVHSEGDLGRMYDFLFRLHSLTKDNPLGLLQWLR